MNEEIWKKNIYERMRFEWKKKTFGYTLREKNIAIIKKKKITAKEYFLKFELFFEKATDLVREKKRLKCPRLCNCEKSM